MQTKTSQHKMPFHLCLSGVSRQCSLLKINNSKQVKEEKKKRLTTYQTHVMQQQKIKLQNKQMVSKWAQVTKTEINE